jgi:hypothetical protein
LRQLDVAPLADQVPLLVSLSLVLPSNPYYVHGYSNLVGIAALSSLAHLTRLECSACSLINSSIVDIARIKTLEVLNVSHNDGVRHLSPLGGLTKLVHLNCAYTKATSLRWVESLAPILRNLNIRGNQRLRSEYIPGVSDPSEGIRLTFHHRPRKGQPPLLHR